MRQRKAHADPGPTASDDIHSGKTLWPRFASHETALAHSCRKSTGKKYAYWHHLWRLRSWIMVCLKKGNPACYKPHSGTYLALSTSAMRDQQSLYILASTESYLSIVQAEGDLYELVQYCLTRLVIEACGVRAYCIFPTG